MVLLVKCRYVQWPRLRLFKALRICSGNTPSIQRSKGFMPGDSYVIFMSPFSPTTSQFRVRQQMRYQAPAESRPGRNRGIGDMINGSNCVLTVPTTTIPLTSRSFLSRPNSRLPPAPTVRHHLHVPLQGVVLYTAYRSGRSAWPDTCSIGESLHTPGLGSHDSNMFIVQARPHVRLYRAGKPNKSCLDPGPESAAIALEDWTAPAPHSLISSTRLHMIAASSGVIPNSPRRGMCRG
jgi:hypothetical protein